jgi:general secretion pathway protein H
VSPGRSTPRRPSAGFTLIELSIALAIATVLFAAVVTGVGAITGARAKEAVGELGGVIRSLYDTAALSGNTCRLVFELPAERDEEGVAKYWAECAKGAHTTRRDRDQELREAGEARGGDSKRPRRSSSELLATGGPEFGELLAAEEQRVERAAKYAGFTSEEIRPRALPPSVKVSVWTRGQKQPARSGLAYLYFFPQGFTERAMVTVRQGGNVWTLTVAPLTGRTAVVPEELEVPRS